MTTPGHSMFVHLGNVRAAHVGVPLDPASAALFKTPRRRSIASALLLFRIRLLRATIVASYVCTVPLLKPCLLRRSFPSWQASPHR
ncbi:hypothetical protein GOP47_0016819 [Adiantum capillus-veneris]|uniref:Uncharacterized protein n=1 Tax=Adiantum capillus-veneris TaxID=13818 RepID=A0A9D4UJ67_ADICA|nr:hypothetical protein GOP47_0016819 [Adiantum capillus-veneris]